MTILWAQDSAFTTGYCNLRYLANIYVCLVGSSTTGTIIASGGVRTKKKPVDKEMRGWSPKLEREQQQDQTSSDIKLSEEEAEQQQQQDSDDEDIPPSLHEDQEEEPAQVASMTTAITTTTVFQPADIHFSLRRPTLHPNR